MPNPRRVYSVQIQVVFVLVNQHLDQKAPHGARGIKRRSGVYQLPRNQAAEPFLFPKPFPDSALFLKRHAILRQKNGVTYLEAPCGCSERISSDAFHGALLG